MRDEPLRRTCSGCDDVLYPTDPPGGEWCMICFLGRSDSEG